MVIMKKLMEHKEPNRFEQTSDSIHSVRLEVYHLEDYLGIHPFPKHKHKAKYIKSLEQ